MKRVLRLMTMWLLVMAMPIQGFAAATMASCGTTHAHPASLVVDHRHAEAASLPAAHVHSGASAHHHHRDASADTHDDAEAVTGAGLVHKCGACAACCPGAAAPMSDSQLAVIELTDSFAPLVTRTLAVFVSEGLERPPRLFFA